MKQSSFLVQLSSKTKCVRDETWSDDVIDVSSFKRIVRHKFTTSSDVGVLKHVTSHSKQTKSGRINNLNNVKRNKGKKSLKYVEERFQVL